MCDASSQHPHIIFDTFAVWNQFSHNVILQFLLSSTLMSSYKLETILYSLFFALLAFWQWEYWKYFPYFCEQHSKNKWSDIMDRRIKYFTFQWNSYWFVVVVVRGISLSISSHMTLWVNLKFNPFHIIVDSDHVSLAHTKCWMNEWEWVVDEEEQSEEWFKNSWIKPQSALRKFEYFLSSSCISSSTTCSW